MEALKSNKSNKAELVEDANIMRNYEVGSLLTFNMEHGFLEGMVRGLRSGFLSSAEYRQLTQCTNFDDVKLTLSDTDYCNVLQNVSELNKDIIMEKCNEKFVQEFQFMRTQAVGALSTFMDFVSYEYLIDNISFLISGLIKRQEHSSYGGASASPSELLEKCDPLGADPHLNSIMGVFENSGDGQDGLMMLYKTVLIDMPVAKYFEQYFNAQKSGGGEHKGGHHEIARIYSEGEFEVITNMLKKYWLEDFYQATQHMGGETALMMKELLGFEADYRAIEMTMNSFGTQLNQSNERDAERKGLFANIGKLYPRTYEKRWQDISDNNKLTDNLKNFFPYEQLWKQATDEGKQPEDQVAIMSDLLKETEIKAMRLAFDGQGHFAVFYAWSKLKQAELRNLRYIFSCIEQHQTDPKVVNKWIPAFPPKNFSSGA